MTVKILIRSVDSIKDLYPNLFILIKLYLTM